MSTTLVAPTALETWQSSNSFLTRGEPGWGYFGETFGADESLTWQEIAKRTHLLNWNVRVRQLDTDARFDPKRPDFEVIRDNPFDGGLDRLGLAKKRYTPYQNERMLEFGSNIVDGGATWQAAGAVKDGRNVFAFLKVDKEILVGDEEIDMFLMLTTSHDGSLALQASMTPYRPVCANVLPMALKGTKQKFTIRHTGKMEERIVLARQALGIAFNYVDAFSVEANALLDASVSNQQFDALIRGLYPEPEVDVKGALTKWETKRDTLHDIWNDKAAGPATTGNTHGTAWGALNALTEYVDWYRTPRGLNGSTNLLEAQAGFDPTVLKTKNTILTAVRTLAGV